MDLYEILQINPDEVKIHLAGWNGIDNPLDVFFDNRFKEWQEEQTKHNFGRKYIVSLINMPGRNLWLFAGIYYSHGIIGQKGNCYLYKTELADIRTDMIGRLVVKHVRKGRNSYPNGENILGNADVYEIMPEPLAMSDFKNFKNVLLTRKQLELIFTHEYPSWKAALSSVAGVYLLSDQATGKLYIGSAYGQGGFWGRWQNYYNYYHGGNCQLKKLLNDNDEFAFDSFNYSILETCDLDLSKDLVIELENLWKKKLLTREFGFNDN